MSQTSGIPVAAALEAALGIANDAVMSVRRIPWFTAVVALSLGVAGCEGDTGPQGPEGPPGPQGPPGETPGTIEPEIFGLVGRVTEPNLMPVPGGTVYLVPASDVAELAQTPIDLFLSPQQTAVYPFDEPIEDLIDLHGETYEQTSVDNDGVYRFVTLPDGDHFVAWFPGTNDATHLPGGDYSRVAFATESLIGMEMDIRVSSRPSTAASYVGSSTCMVCHGLQSTTRTAHNVGLQVPGVRSILQDVGPWPGFDDGLAAFDDGTTLFYFDCNPTFSSASKCAVQIAQPPANVSFEVSLRRDPAIVLGEVGAYYVEITNRINAEAPRRYDVVLTYGGAVEQQRYLMRRTNPDGSFSYFVLMVQYNYQGDFANPNPEDWPWSDYRSELWFDFDAGTLTEPANEESFDNNCAGCHFTGYRLEGSEEAGWSASAVVDTEGAFDYDGDGRPELINTGCEGCHGPGSDHLEQSPMGSYIVSPQLLTPGREAAICGSCHSRPLGIGAGETGLPLSSENDMPPPGIRRAEFAPEYTTRVSGAPDDFFDSGDPRVHYQQYSDHIRSNHYRNPVRISTCTGCHDPHANLDDVYGMDDSGENNAICTVCHSPPEFPPLLQHVQEATGSTIHDIVEAPFFCADCHMVPTAKSGAAVRALLDTIGGPPDVQYFWNDISAHRMSMTSRQAYMEQPVAATNRCAPCHGAFFPND